MGFVRIRDGRQFRKDIPAQLELPVAVADGGGTGLITLPSSNSEALVRWMFRQGYVPQEDLEGEPKSES